MSVREAVEDNRVLTTIVLLTLLGLVGRLAFLGSRFAHWDEGRVGYDILRFMATGVWEYRPIVHGPFLPHVNKVLFEWFGPSDFTARLVVALVGAGLPLAAWLYRDHLRDVELVALAFFLAADPILVYYSRFMRNDVLVAAFIFFGVGFLLRLIETDQPRYLYAATTVTALAFTTKENAILYVLALLGALVLLLDHRLFLARETTPHWTTVAWRYIRTTSRGLRRYSRHLLLAGIEFFVIIVYFYAPRNPAPGELGLSTTFSDPTRLPDLIEAATVGAADKLVTNWVMGELSAHAYLPFLASYLEKLGSASGPLALLAVFGFLVDRYRGDRPRDLVALSFYWGFVSILGYPIVIDIRSAWAVTHSLVPLAIPAAVGIALIYDWGREASEANDKVSVALAAVVLLLVAGQVAGTTVSTSYVNQQENTLVQFAQPADDMRPAVRIVQRTAPTNEGVDVVYHGSRFALDDETSADRLPVADGDWYHRLPMPWYHEMHNATVNSTETLDDLDTQLAANRPPVIMTCRDAEGCPVPEQLSTQLADRDYEKFATYRGRYLPGNQSVVKFVFYVDEAHLDRDRAV